MIQPRCIGEIEEWKVYEIRCEYKGYKCEMRGNIGNINKYSKEM